MGAKCCAGEELKNGQQEATVTPLVTSTQPLAEETIKSAAAPPAAGAAEDTRAAKDEFTITIKKTEGNSRLGVDVDLAEGGFLYVDKVNEGLVMDWNKANPDKEVRCGDKVISVNGTKGDAMAMTDACKNGRELEMIIQRAD